MVNCVHHNWGTCPVLYPKELTDLKTRILVAAIGLPLLLLIVLVLPSVATAILVAAMSVVAVYVLLVGTGLCRQVRIFACSGVMAGGGGGGGGG